MVIKGGNGSYAEQKAYKYHIALFHGEYTYHNIVILDYDRIAGGMPGSLKIVANKGKA